ncbi:MAG: serine--tRNA ligase [Candidatus Uhrbacteria bacterium]|nr:serine--tRNA ligase [Candidatus Uhrbacteria bacterium]
MLDIKFIREHADIVKKNCEDRNMRVDIDALLRVDAARLDLLKEVELLRKERNEIADVMKSASPDQRPAFIERGKALKESLAVKEADLVAAEGEWLTLLLQVPNIASPEAPVGNTDEDNKEVRRSGEIPVIEEVKDHVELGKTLDILDFERGAKVSGNKFYYLKGKLALLEQALIRFALDEAVAHGFTPMTTPDVAKDEMLSGTGYTPRGNESQIYSIENQDISLIGTAEITVAGYYQGEIIEEEKLPMRIVGFSHCYRTEAGAYGRESYGLYRVHQFSKVELFIYASPEQSEAMHQELLRVEEAIWTKLGIPYRVLDICTGDLGAPYTRKYDLEAWMPGKSNANGGRGEWGEITSTSNCSDYQARRLGIRVKRPNGSIEFLHTLNGTAIATSRGMIAVLENGQQPDGSIRIPDALIPYCGFDRIS